MAFYAKIGSDVISDLSFAEILATSQKIANYLINKIKLIPKGGHPLIIAIGGTVGFFVSEEMGDITEYFINGIADFIANDIIIDKGRKFKKFFKPIEDFLQQNFNLPAKPTCPKGSKMPDGRCAPSVQELWQGIFLLSSTYPKLSSSYKEALERIKELDSKFKLASSNHIQSDVEFDYFSQDDMQEYYKKQMIIASEEKNYKNELENYEKELEYKSNIISYCLEQLNKIILLQIIQNKDLQYNETLGILSKNSYTIKILDEKDIDSINHKHFKNKL